MDSRIDSLDFHQKILRWHEYILRKYILSIISEFGDFDNISFSVFRKKMSLTGDSYVNPSNPAPQ